MRKSARAVRASRRAHISALLLTVSAAMVGVLALTVTAFASHGSPFIDLTTVGAGVQHNTAAFVQGGVGAGTGLGTAGGAETTGGVAAAGASESAVVVSGRAGNCSVRALGSSEDVNAT